jgi:adenylylsulfate kinase
MTSDRTHVVWHAHTVAREDRERLNGHEGCVVWFTGLARRFGLTFSSEDRTENIRRIGAVAELFAAAGLVTLTAFVSPYRADRDAVRTAVNGSRPGSFIEVFVDAPLEVCESRDPKGFYKKARAGEISGFTGINDDYESPQSPELRLDAAAHTPEELARQVLAFLHSLKKIP